MRIAQEEIFGPVLSVIAYADEDEAIAIANDSDFGLNGAVFSIDLEHGLQIAERIRTGTVEINGSPAGCQRTDGRRQSQRHRPRERPGRPCPLYRTQSDWFAGGTGPALDEPKQRRSVTPTKVAPDVDVVSHLARHAAGATYDALPPPAVEAAKKSILDTSGSFWRRAERSLPFEASSTWSGRPAAGRSRRARLR